MFFFLVESGDWKARVGNLPAEVNAWWWCSHLFVCFVFLHIYLALNRKSPYLVFGCAYVRSLRTESVIN